MEGLHASLDKLVHHREKSKMEGIDLHAFIYFISISNLSDRSITLRGIKWILANDDGTKTVVEGEKIVGESPKIPPGETFSYNSFHYKGSFDLDVFFMKFKFMASYFNLSFNGFDNLTKIIW